uniref:Uncharacterized protein n=1 Tax=Oryza punctata TaxID=4537 RepID=A0A0E0JHM9_ORYPU
MAVAGELWPTAVEAKPLLRAWLSDAGQHLNLKGGVHLRQEQQPMMHGCYCATSSSSLYHANTSFHDSFVDYHSPSDVEGWE